MLKELFLVYFVLGWEILVIYRSPCTHSVLVQWILKIHLIYKAIYSLFNKARNY